MNSTRFTSNGAGKGQAVAAALASQSANQPPLQRHSSWHRDAALLGALGLLLLLCPSVMGWNWLACLAGGSGCVGAAAKRVQHGRRAEQREEITDHLVEALTKPLGYRQPDRAMVRATKWTGPGPGHPQVVNLRYFPGVDADDPQWKGEVLAIVGRRLQSSYRIKRHQVNKCRLILEPAPETTVEEVAPVQQRAERTISELLGPTARVTELQWEEGDGQGRTELAAVEVSHEAGIKLASPAYRNRIERVYSTMLPGRWRASWDLETDSARFEVRPSLPAQVPHPAPETSSTQLPMAVDEDGRTVHWNLRGTAPHAMVVGKTGTGKTVVINGLVMEACARGWPVWICDPKRVEFMGMRGWPNVQIVATTIEDQISTIYAAWREMEDRYRRVEDGAVESDFEPIIVVLDEYRDFVAAATAWYASVKVRGMPAKCPVFEQVGSIARKGRTARIHMILGTQRPDADFLGGETRDNFATRMSLGRLSPQGAMMMWEAAYVGVSVPRNVPGRGTGVDENDRPCEVQAYWTPDPRRTSPSDVSDHAILSRLHPGEAKHPQLQVTWPTFDEEVSTDDAGELIAELAWPAVTQATLEVRTTSFPDPLEIGTQPAAPLTPAARLAMISAPPAEPEREPEPETPSAATEKTQRHLSVVPDDEPEEDEYLDVDEVAAADLHAGDLIQLEDTGIWVVLESDPEPDIDDDDSRCLEWRGDLGASGSDDGEDDAGVLIVPADQNFPTRRPVEIDDEETTR